MSLQDQMRLWLEGQIAIEVAAEGQKNFFLTFDEATRGIVHSWPRGLEIYAVQREAAFQFNYFGWDSYSFHLNGYAAIGCAASSIIDVP